MSAAEAEPLVAAGGVSIEPMARHHVKGVVAIEEQVYPRPWTASLFRTELGLGNQRTYLVATAGRRVVGYGGVMYVLPDAHVTTVAVDPASRQQGIGTRLLLALCREAVARGATALTLEVRVSNEAAQSLYRRFGFVPAGARKAYYSDNREDALVMWNHDIDQPAFADRLAAITRDIDDAGWRRP